MNFNDAADKIIEENRRSHYKRMSILNQKLKESTPRVLKKIVVYGDFYTNIYDHVPSYGCFTSQGSKTIAIPDGCNIDQAKTTALASFNELLAIFDEEARAGETFEPYDGLFCPRFIVLLDQYGECLDRYRNGEWADTIGLPTHEEWDDLLLRVKELRSEASLEAGWDNFSTASSLRDEASAIEQSVQVAKSKLV